MTIRVDGLPPDPATIPEGVAKSWEEELEASYEREDKGDAPARDDYPDNPPERD